MHVVAHGNVDVYCESHNMQITERYEGKLENYTGSGLIIVTDNCSDINDFYCLKLKLMRKKITLISTHWEDKALSEFVEYLKKADKRSLNGGRLPFGFRRVKGKIVHNEEAFKIARRIIELRDEGETYKSITEDPGVHHLDGRKMGISTIQVILSNRSKYEEY